jgi:hypothetical protein
MGAPNENVLVVRRSLFDKLGSFQGLQFEPQPYLDAMLARGNNYFLARASAENDPTHKQIIPTQSWLAAIVFCTMCVAKKPASSDSSPKARSASAGT